MTTFIKVGAGFPVSYENNEDYLLANVKAERNAKLAETDVYMIEDFPTTKKAEWKAYRKALRDMDFSDPDNITWPDRPE
tara:strand:- start:232 stop:468 length:237 start_codon:yes stop_codon:yes gene_type:complete